MTRWDEFRRLTAVYLAILPIFIFEGARCELQVYPVSPTLVKAVAGSNVTLDVSFSGASDPTVTWSTTNTPVVIWTINSTIPPDIDKSRMEVLRINPNGSLSFVNVPLNFTGKYTVEMAKSGQEKSVTSFFLRIFEIIQDVNLSIEPQLIIEGTEQFTLRYSMEQGVVEHQMWYFNQREIMPNQHYSVQEQSLVVHKPSRNDTGEYSVNLTNPFSGKTNKFAVLVRYGPDEPSLMVQPARPFHVTGDSLNLTCQAEGVPPPTFKWEFNGVPLSEEPSLNLTNVLASERGMYTCTVESELTGARRQRSVTLAVYERPSGNPVCSVESVASINLQYHCQWSGGVPPAHLMFPALSDSSHGTESFSLMVPASDELNGKTITCSAHHPLQQNSCNVTASSPGRFLPAVRTAVDAEGKIVVTLFCVSEALPRAVVSWTRGGEAVAGGAMHQISRNTTQLEIRHYNISNILLHNYTCICRNPLGSQRRDIHLRGPSISDFSLFPNSDGTVITLTWEVPPTSVVTGFDIQMKGPDLLSKAHSGAQSKGSSNQYRTIQLKPGTARSADVFPLDPDATYRFRVIPKARMTEGTPSESHRIGPGEGLSGPAIAGIAAGIPCSLVFLLLLAFFIYLCIYCSKKQSRQTRYPVSRAVDKVITTQTDITPHHLLTAGLKSPPDYNRLQQTPSERSVDLPSFVPPPPTRVATTV